MANKVADEIRGNREIKSKVVVDFGNGYRKTIPEIEAIKKVIAQRDGTETPRINQIK